MRPIRYIHELEKYDLEMIEQPLVKNDHRWDGHGPGSHLDSDRRG